MFDLRLSQKAAAAEHKAAIASVSFTTATEFYKPTQKHEGSFVFFLKVKTNYHKLKTESICIPFSVECFELIIFLHENELDNKCRKNLLSCSNKC